MDNDIFGDYHTAQDDFTGFVHWFDFVFWNFRRIFSEQCMFRDKDILFRCV